MPSQPCHQPCHRHTDNICCPSLINPVVCSENKLLRHNSPRTKPCRLSRISPCLSTCQWILSLRLPSNNFHTTGARLTGLSFPGLSLQPFLKKDTTLATHQYPSTSPLGEGDANICQLSCSFLRTSLLIYPSQYLPQHYSSISVIP